MSGYYTELSKNQREAVGQTCKVCHMGTYTQRTGTYGVFVGCSRFPACKAKVYRPRGAWVARGTVEVGNQRVVIPPTAEPPQVVSESSRQDEPQAAISQHDTSECLQRFGQASKRIDGLQADVARLERAAGELETQLASVRANSPQIIEVKRQNGETAVVKDAHCLMPRLLKLLSADFHVYLWGPAGSGKTTAALQAAEALGHAAEIDTLDPTTFRSMVQGYMTPQGEPVHTAFTRCWCEGKVYVGDEMDNAPGHVQTLFNSALANHHAPLAWGNVAKRETFAFVGTGNTPGRPTRDFPDRKPMSAAFMDRLYFVHWPIDPAIECRAGGLPIPARQGPSYEPIEPSKWVSWVQRLRSWAVDNAPTLMVTPRASLAGLKALAIGESPMDVADALVFRGADSELRSKALNAVRLV